MLQTRYVNTIALGASLLLHAGLLYLGREIAERVSPAAADANAGSTRELRSPVYLARSEDPAPLPAASAPEPMELSVLEPPPLPEPEPILIPPIDILPPEPVLPIRRPDGFGQLTGAPDATALHALDGDQPMQALQADRDQAPLARNDETPAPPEMPEPPADGPLAAAQVSEPAPPVEQEPSQPDPRLAHADPEPMPVADPDLPGLLAHAAPIAPSSLSQAAPNRAVASPRPASLATPDRPAHRAVSDSDSDPFSTHGSTEFRPGRVSAAFGRQVKTVRPKLSLAAQYDLLGLPEPRVKLHVRVDETGQVRQVIIRQSSGSTQIDQACQLAMYQWWFEPQKDAAGKPAASELLWTIVFRYR